MKQRIVNYPSSDKEAFHCSHTTKFYSNSQLVGEAPNANNTHVFDPFLLAGQPNPTNNVHCFHVEKPDPMNKQLTCGRHEAAQNTPRNTHCSKHGGSKAIESTIINSINTTTNSLSLGYNTCGEQLSHLPIK